MSSEQVICDTQKGDFWDENYEGSAFAVSDGSIIISFIVMHDCPAEVKHSQAKP